VARCRTVAFVFGARNTGLPSGPIDSSTFISANSGRMLSTVASGLSLPRSIRIMAAVLPTALVIEKIRNTVSTAAGCPGLASPAAPLHSTPSLLPSVATTKGTSLRDTASRMTRSNSFMLCLQLVGKRTLRLFPAF